MITERLYDVFVVTREKVITRAVNVSKDDALLTMSKALADYGDNWQLQSEYPTGCVKVVNLHSQEYHIVLVIETDLSHRRHEMKRAAEHQPWLARSVNLEDLVTYGESSIDFTVDPDRTPTEFLDAVRDGADMVEEVTYAYQI